MKTILVTGCGIHDIMKELINNYKNG